MILFKKHLLLFSVLALMASSQTVEVQAQPTNAEKFQSEGMGNIAEVLLYEAINDFTNTALGHYMNSKSTALNTFATVLKEENIDSRINEFANAIYENKVFGQLRVQIKEILILVYNQADQAKQKSTKICALTPSNCASEDSMVQSLTDIIEATFQQIKTKVDAQTAPDF